MSADKTLTCTETPCGKTFNFTEGEQKFYSEKGFAEPRRCPECRAARKASKTPSAPSAPRRVAPAIEWVNAEAVGANEWVSNKQKSRRSGGNSRTRRYNDD
jgi:hypothetical protein